MGTLSAGSSHYDSSTERFSNLERRANEVVIDLQQSQTQPPIIIHETFEGERVVVVGKVCTDDEQTHELDI